MDTLDTQTQDTTQTQDSVNTAPIQKAEPAFSWKNSLNADFANSPTMQKYADTKEGFNDAVKAHLELQKMLGNEKVPIPKGKDDPARALFNKALGIPDKPEGYSLQDVDIPENLKGITFDKKKFAEVVHKHDLTPSAAKGLWEVYTSMSKQMYADAIKQQQDALTNSVNQLRQTWGDAYQSKVELSQMVINKFSDDQDVNDFITSTLISDPRGAKFLAKIGEQFSENKIGDFKYQRHSLTAEEAQREIDDIIRDPNHPYSNPKASQLEHDKAVEYVNSLYQSVRRSRGNA